MKRVIYLLMIASLFSSCTEQKSELNKPESIALDGEFMYVSNVNGPPMEKDGNGYISKLHKNGKVHTSNFIEGLNAPKGMLIINDVLYVTDIDRIFGYELPKGKKVFECSIVDTTQFLNDITYDGQDHMYVSATDINEIFEINIKNKSLRNLGLGNQLNGPNGVFYHDGILYVCEMGGETGKGTVKSVHLTKDSVLVTKLTDYTGMLDGLALYNDKLYFSDWVTREEEGKSRLMFLDIHSKNYSPVKVHEPMTGCADFYIDETSKKIIAPIMMDHKVIFIPL